MRRLVALVAVSALCLATAGCAGYRPTWLFPENTAAGREAARRYDPYPEPGVGPAIHGGRPPSYEKPQAEVQRVQPPLPPTHSRWVP